MTKGKAIQLTDPVEIMRRDARRQSVAKSHNKAAAMFPERERTRIDNMRQRWHDHHDLRMEAQDYLIDELKRWGMDPTDSMKDQREDSGTAILCRAAARLLQEVDGKAGPRRNAG